MQFYVFVLYSCHQQWLTPAVALSRRLHRVSWHLQLHLLLMQVMQPSHVGSGYWCQCPRNLLPHLPGITSNLLFETHDRRVSPSSFRYVNAEVCDGGGGGQTGSWVWEVKLLHREKGGVGFSGGWRGFAIDQVTGPKGVQGSLQLTG